MLLLPEHTESCPHVCFIPLKYYWRPDSPEDHISKYSDVWCNLCSSFHDTTGCPGKPYYNDPAIKRDPVKGDIVCALLWPGEKDSPVVCGVFDGWVGFDRDRAALNSLDPSQGYCHVRGSTITFNYPAGYRYNQVYTKDVPEKVTPISTRRGIWLEPRNMFDAGLGIVLSWGKFKGLGLRLGPLSICLGVRG